MVHRLTSSRSTPVLGAPEQRPPRWRRTTHRIAGLRRMLVASAVAIAASVPMVAVAAPPASAAFYNCSTGLNTANTAWGHCSSGSGWWQLHVTCYYWGGSTSYANGPGSIYASCPGWSHVTSRWITTGG